MKNKKFLEVIKEHGLNRYLVNGLVKAQTLEKIINLLDKNYSIFISISRSVGGKYKYHLQTYEGVGPGWVTKFNVSNYPTKREAQIKGIIEACFAIKERK